MHASVDFVANNYCDMYDSLTQVNIQGIKQGILNNPYPQCNQRQGGCKSVTKDSKLFGHSVLL